MKRRDWFLLPALFPVVVMVALGSGCEPGGGESGAANSGGEATGEAEKEPRAGLPDTDRGEPGEETPTAKVDTTGDGQRGTIGGKVNFTGDPPSMPEIDFSADPNCVKVHKGSVRSEEVVVNANGTLKNVFVYVSEGLEGKTFPVPKEEVVFDQVGCRFQPHVFGIQTDQTLKLLNSDPTLHNVHGLPRRHREFNTGLSQNKFITKTFDKREVMFQIKCDVHPWMSAWCGVVEHPYFSVTDGKGEFRIDGLAPGKYTLTAVHEKFGSRTRKIEVASGERRTIDFEYEGTP